MTDIPKMISNVKQLYDIILEHQRNLPLDHRTPHTYLHDKGQIACPCSFTGEPVLVAVSGEINGKIRCPYCNCDVPVNTTKPENAIDVAKIVRPDCPTEAVNEK